MFANLASIGMLGILNSHDISYCCGCEPEKIYALPYKSVISYIALFILCIMMCGSHHQISSKVGSSYYVSFIDDYTHYTWVHVMKHMYDFFTIYSDF